jgi:hypothetical protein
MNTVIIGIDPGASGGICQMFPNGSVELMAMPEKSELREFIYEEAQNAAMNQHQMIAVMEQVGGFIAGKPRPGSRMFKMGEGYGYIQGLLAMSQIPLHLVRPQKWQEGIPGVAGKKDNARKRALKEHAVRLFPKLKITLKTCDALLIAEWARLNIK